MQVSWPELLVGFGSDVLWIFAVYKPKPGCFHNGTREERSRLWHEAACPHSGVRRKMSLLKCSGEGLSVIEVSPAGRRGGEEVLPCLKDSGPVDSHISGAAVFGSSMPAKVHVKEG